MKGYDNLFKLNIPSKTLEASFLLLNRQIWTNAKERHIDRGGVGEEAEDGGGRGDRCSLCQGTENTMHLMFECPAYSEPLWETLSEIINDMIGMENPNATRFSLHAFQVLYNMYKAPIPAQHAKQIAEVCQELKRNIIYRRYVRCTGGMNIVYNRNRILSHIFNALNKMGALRKHQGKVHDTICSLADIAKGKLNS
jgi:hypothetical protein